MRDNGAPPLREDGLQLREQRTIQRKLWCIERAAWFGFAIILLAAVAGLTGGGGYFSSQRISFETAAVQLPRISRWQATEKASFEVDAAPVIIIHFSPAFSETFAIETLIPAPKRSVIVPDGLSLHFEAAGHGRKAINMTLRAVRPGWASFEVAVGGENRRAGVLVLP